MTLVPISRLLTRLRAGAFDVGWLLLALCLSPFFPGRVLTLGRFALRLLRSFWS